MGDMVISNGLLLLIEVGMFIVPHEHIDGLLTDGQTLYWRVITAIMLPALIHHYSPQSQRGY